MRAAEFRCAREFLGLSANWVAVQLCVRAETVNGWERIGAKVPDYAAAFMENEISVAAKTVGTLTVEWEKQKGLEALPAPSDNSRHDAYPALYYRMIASRVAERIGAGIDYKA